MTSTFSARLFLMAVAAASAAGADDWSKSFTVTGRPELRIDGDDGSVTVRTWDRKEITVHITTVGWKIGPGEVRVTDRQTGDKVEIGVRTPHLSFSIGRRSVRVEVQAPREMRADIHTGDGAIDIAGVKGETRLSTGDGHIEADLLDGKLDAHTGDGRIRVRGRFDLLSLQTGDGSVEAAAERGSKVTAEWRVRTGDGHVTLRLPEGLAADLDAHTGDGRITSDLNVAAAGSTREHELRGKLNGGGAPLVVRTNDGAIRLERL